MKRFFAVFAVIFAMFFTVCGRAFADDLDYGREQIEDALPEGAGEILDEKGITPDNSGALNLTFGGVLSWLWDLFKSEAGKPFTLFCVLGAAILLTALAESLAEQGNLKGVVSVVGVLCSAGAAAVAMNDVLNETLGALSDELDERFFRIGRSAVVNLSHVRRVTKTDAILSDGAAVPLPRGAYEPLNRAIIART